MDASRSATKGGLSSNAIGPHSSAQSSGKARSLPEALASIPKKGPVPAELREYLLAAIPNELNKISPGVATSPLTIQTAGAWKLGAIVPEDSFWKVDNKATAEALMAKAVEMRRATEALDRAMNPMELREGQHWYEYVFDPKEHSEGQCLVSMLAHAADVYAKRASGRVDALDDIWTDPPAGSGVVNPGVPSPGPQLPPPSPHRPLTNYGRIDPKNVALLAFKEAATNGEFTLCPNPNYIDQHITDKELAHLRERFVSGDLRENARDLYRLERVVSDIFQDRVRMSDDEKADPNSRSAKELRRLGLKPDEAEAIFHAASEIKRTLKQRQEDEIVRRWR